MCIFKDKERVHTLFCFFMSAGIVLVMIAAVYFRAGIYFDTNDDRFLSEILSGVYGEHPEPHTIYMNYLLSLPLTALYRITIKIPWHGLMLLTFHMVTYTTISNSILRLCRNKVQMLLGMSVLPALGLQGIYILAKIQYTSTTVLLAAAGYIYLLLHNKNLKSRLKIFAIFMLLSCLLRKDAMLMIQPLGIAATAGALLVDKGKSLKAKIIELSAVTGTIAICVLTAEAGTVIGYHSEEWKYYFRYNNAGVEIFDYYGKPEYEEIAGILDKYDVSKAEYEAFKGYVILDGNLNADCAEEIAAYAKSKYVFPTLKELLDSYRKTLWNDAVWKINKIMIITMFMVCMILILCGQYRYLLPVGLIKAAACIVWCFLLYRGRLPLRVSLPLYIVETEFYLSIFILAMSNAKNKRIWRRACVIAAAGIFCFMSFQTGRQQYRFARTQNEGMEQYMAVFWEINAYCNEHSNDRYLLDAVSVSYYSGAVLETKFNGPRNNLVSGTWFSCSPVMNRKMRDYFKDEEKGFYLIIYDYGYENIHPTVAYLQEKTGEKAVLADEFTASNGGKYLVYYFDRGLKFQG